MSNFINYGMLHEPHYTLANGLELKNYTIGEMMDVGENRYYTLLQYLICTASELMIELYDAGFDFRKIDDFDLFIGNITKNGKVNNELLSFFIKDADFSLISDENNTYLKSNVNDTFIDKDIHYEMANVLRISNGLSINKDKLYNPADESTFEFIIEMLKEKRDIKNNMIKQGKIDLNKNSIFYSILPAVVNHGNNGISYFNYRELKLFELLESFEQHNNMLNYKLVMQGVYYGNVKYQSDFTYLRQ